MTPALLLLALATSGAAPHTTYVAAAPPESSHVWAAGIGGAAGALGGLAVVGGYLAWSSRGGGFSLPFGGYEILLAVPLLTAIGAPLAVIINGGSLTDAGAAAGGALVASTLGVAAAVVIGAATAVIVNQLTPPGGFDIGHEVAGVVVGSLALVVVAAAAPAFAVELVE